MEIFIDEIVYDSEKLKDDSNYKNFRNYLCYESRTDFFDLYRVIRNHIRGQDSSGNPTMEIIVSHYTQLTKANLQKSIGWIYEGKKRSDPSHQQVNDDMLDALYEFVEAMEDGPNPKIVNIHNDKINILNANTNTAEKIIEHTKLHKMSSVLDMQLLLKKQGYLTPDGANRYRVTGKLHEFNTKGIFVEEQRTFTESFDKFKEITVNFANMYNKFVEGQGTPFNIKNFEPKWEIIKQKISNVYGPDLPNDVKDTYDRLKAPDPPFIEFETLQKQTYSLNSILDSLIIHHVNLLAQILGKRLDTACAVNIDLSSVFNQITIPNQHIHNATLRLQQNNSISNIVLLHSPPINMLKSIAEKQTDSNDLVICLGDATTISNYKEKEFVVDDFEILKKMVNDFFNDPYYTNNNAGFVPEKDPELRDGEHKTFFFAVQAPLCPDMVEKVLDLTDKIMTYSS